MKNTVLLEAISAEDKIKIESYINKFGVIKNNFIGIDKWLQFWSYSKQKLFKLLGNQLIYKIDINYEKNRNIFETELHFLIDNHPFKISYQAFLISEIIGYYENGIIDEETKKGFFKLIDFHVFLEDSVKIPIKMKKPGCKKMLQIQAGTKPIRAFSKIVTYFKDEYNFKDFEDFRIAHSIILNDKFIKGKLCLSIHPLDFITMSDNNSAWSSCMSWTNDGCYHLGTVEMMNSNNVICCYIEGNDPFVWEDLDLKEDITWNNKKFRVLAYVTKDIIVNGKSYPYQNVDIVKIIINTIRRLAKENLNWTYSFGPERYKDMIHINYAADMERNKQWIHWGEATKHNIIFDTNAMYNDMFNDNNREYWCYRNKVKRNKVINLSGKSNCLCCNEDVKIFADNYDYNERFGNSDSIICNDCRIKFECFCCGGFLPTTKKYNILFYDSYNTCYLKEQICYDCWKRYVKICPDCGKPFFFNYRGDFNNIIKYGEIVHKDYFAKKYILNSEEAYKYSSREELISKYYKYFELDANQKEDENKDLDILYIEKLYLHNCKPCSDYLSNLEYFYINTTSPWMHNFKRIEVIPEEIAKNKYGYHALKTPEWHPDFIFEK